MKKQIFNTEVGGRQLKIEINDLAEQAAGSVFVQYGDTLVLATAVMAENEKEGVDFFPLTVEYEERYYAAGKILGSRYLRRESRPSDEAILTSRFIDRAIRPLFYKNFKRETQIIITCLSWDGENDPDIVGLIAASLAIGISNIPWRGPLAAIRIGRQNNEFSLNPTYKDRENNDFDLALVGLKSELAKFLGNPEKDKILINMIEAEAKETEESLILEAVKFAKPHLEKLLDFQEEIVKKAGKEKIKMEEKPKNSDLEREMEGFLGKRLENAIFSSDQELKSLELESLKKEFVSYFEEKINNTPGIEMKKSQLYDFLEDKIDSIVHERIIKTERRPDARKLNEIREIQTEAGLIPRSHGSGLFCRGKTKALSILTLGAPSDVKLLEGMETIGKKRFMHHYNFPPYCSGEAKPVRGPGRREIGHGMLAEKALLPLIPDFDQFPYTIRIVTEILSSNGSTSMASVSSSALALMDAGVPIKNPAAGIAVGLMQDNKGNYKILTDIQGPEDHYGDMDFKIAGTKKGITAIQMDVKIEGIGQEILKKALEAGKIARTEILEKISKTIASPRPELSPYAPRIIILQINPEKIREVIGPGGKVINEIIDECGVSIDIEDSGKIFITAESETAAKKATEWIKNITREVMVGETFQGKVKRILNFGAFVEILPGQEGLVHISQLANYRVNKVEDIVKVGDVVPVKVISIDEQGRINLSLKEAKK